VKETKLIVQHTASSMDEVKCWSSHKYHLYLRLNLSGHQFKRLLREWLSPSDPSTNQNIAQKAQHKGTAVWLFQGSIVTEWKSSIGSLLWIHGKRAFCRGFCHHHPQLRLLTNSDHLSGLREERYLVCWTFPPPSQNLCFFKFFCYSRHYVYVQNWISHHDLLLL
jgi:hypothetical protein